MFEGDKVWVWNAHVRGLEDLLVGSAFANAFDLLRVLSYAGDGGGGIARFIVPR